MAAPPDPSDPVDACLLACLRAGWDPAALDAARAAAAEPAFRWEAWLALALAERLGPLAYAALRAADLLPRELRERLRQEHLRTAVQNTLRLDTLAAILAALEAAGIAAIVLKGAALAETLYAEIAVRPMDDLDLLVRRADGAAALAVLEGLGYARVEPEARAGAALAWENEVCLARQQPLAHVVELHWSLFDSPHYQQRLPMDWFWETARPATVAGRPARVLGDEAQLLHLCGHLALHHGGQGWLWHHDVAALVAGRGMALDWEVVAAQAQRCELVGALQVVLERVVAAWRAPVPPEALARVRALRPSDAERRATATLAAPAATVAGRLRDDLAAMPGWGARWRYALASLFPSPAYMRQRYAIRHTWLLPLYYPWRWWVGLMRRR